MDTEKFIKEKVRMCYSIAGGYCSTNCPLMRKFDTCNVDSLVVKNNIKEAISIVEEWSAAHPRKTRQDIFLKQYPNCMIDHDGVVGICPKNVDKNYICDLERFYDCYSCRCEFWSQEVG